MNEQKTNISERIASRLLRLLAIVGLIAVLAIVVWGIVQGVRLLPNADKNITAAVSAIKGVFKKAPEESLVFELDRRTFNVGDDAKLHWSYTGENKPETYSFSYKCDSDITLTIMLDSGWTNVACGEEVKIDTDNISIIPNNDKERFSDTEITIKSSELEDATVISVINKDIYGISNTSDRKTNKNEKDRKGDNSVTSDNKTAIKKGNGVTSENTNDVTATSKKHNSNSSTAKPNHNKTIVTTETHTQKTSDLVLNIEETGIMLTVSGENKFFPVSPIPVNKVAGVKFTVTNRGGKKSGGWVFKAKLPIDGNSNYEYISPIQEGLAPGMQIEYTLGFDELLNKEKGLVKLEIVPSDKTDKETNNTDTAILEIDTE